MKIERNVSYICELSNSELTVLVEALLEFKINHTPDHYLYDETITVHKQLRDALEQDKFL